ncbi:MAG: ATP-binding cassette domain-containing protein, partial [Jatrophihabitantaceae bacterium]
MANLINLENVSKSYGTTNVLDAVSLGIGDADQIGVVGRNGGGKSTLLRMITATEP